MSKTGNELNEKSVSFFENMGSSQFKKSHKQGGYVFIGKYGHLFSANELLAKKDSADKTT